MSTQSHRPVVRTLISVVTAKFGRHPKDGGSFQNNWANHKIPMTTREISRPVRLAFSIRTLSDSRNFLILAFLPRFESLPRSDHTIDKRGYQWPDRWSRYRFGAFPFPAASGQAAIQVPLGGSHKRSRPLTHVALQVVSLAPGAFRGSLHRSGHAASCRRRRKQNQISYRRGRAKWDGHCRGW